MEDEQPEELDVLISGYIDGELDEEQRQRLEAWMARDPAVRREIESMQRLVVGTNRALHAPEVPREQWDRFMDDVYNRLEQKTGWWLLGAGVGVLVLWGVVLYIREPWASAYVKVLLATPVAGLGLLFVSVLRQRLLARQTDRYSREIHR